MESTAWWGSGVFTVVGVVLTGLFGELRSRHTERAERRRLSRADKDKVYQDLTDAGRGLALTPPWPADTPSGRDTLKDQVDKLVHLADHAARYGPPKVNATIEELLITARRHRDLIKEIRTNSKPGYDNGIEQRLRPKYRASVVALHNAIDEFVRANRIDLEIGGRYRSIWKHQNLDKKPADSERAIGS